MDWFAIAAVLMGLTGVSELRGALARGRRYRELYLRYRYVEQIIMLRLISDAVLVLGCFGFVLLWVSQFIVPRGFAVSPVVTSVSLYVVLLLPFVAICARMAADYLRRMAHQESYSEAPRRDD